MKNIFILLFFFILSSNVVADCYESVRILQGEEPLVSSLYEAAKKIPHGSWRDGEFGKETFTYLGLLKIGDKTTFVTYLHTTWGAGSCGRATFRLIFFDEAHQEIGQYYGVQKPIIENALLVFPKGEIGDSAISIEKGLPSQLNDGDDYYPLSIYKR